MSYKLLFPRILASFVLLAPIMNPPSVTLAAAPSLQENPESKFEKDGEAPPRGAGIVIEILTADGFQPLDFSLVATASPTIRIRGQLPSGFRVFHHRPDGRAGILGGPQGRGKEVTSLFIEISPDVRTAPLEVLVGINSIIVTNSSAASVLASSTMLNYSLSYEDMNGNDLLDTGEDIDHDGVLDDGEDVNGNGELDRSEDVNLNGALDPGEDFNGNQLLDPDEDVNNNGILDIDEDIDQNGSLEQGEDLNGNGQIDPIARDINALRQEGDLIKNPFTGETIHGGSLILKFLTGTPPTEISNYLRNKGLRPIGVSFAFPEMTKPKLVVVAVPPSTTSYELQRELNRVSTEPGTFPIVETPVDPPLDLAISDAVDEVGDLDVPAEDLPRRLINGAGANAGDSYDDTTGGFDRLGNAPDELEIFWYHFLMETFAAHRLSSRLRQGVGIAFDDVPGIAIVDTGLGDGTRRVSGGGGLYRGMTMLRITDCSGGNCSNVTLDSIRDTHNNNAGVNVGHGTGVAFFAAGDGTSTLGTGGALRVHVWPLRVTGNRLETANALKEFARESRAQVVNLSWQFTDFDTNPADGVLDANELNRFDQAFRDLSEAYADAIRALEGSGKIVTLIAGNRAPAMTDEHSFLRVFNVPARGFRVDGAANALFIGVGGTDRQALLHGRERYATFSQTGPRVSVSAPGARLPCVRPDFVNTFNFPCQGTSFAAPMVAGLAAELLVFNNIPSFGSFSAFQVVEVIEATADDLGTGDNTDPEFPNNSQPGNGSDDR